METRLFPFFDDCRKRMVAFPASIPQGMAGFIFLQGCWGQTQNWMTQLSSSLVVPTRTARETTAPSMR